MVPGVLQFSSPNTVKVLLQTIFLRKKQNCKKLIAKYTKKNFFCIYFIVYKCEENIIFMTQDFLKINDKVSIGIDCVILCPPWGGQNYNEDNRFLLDDQIEPSLSKIISKTLKFTQNFII